MACQYINDCQRAKEGAYCYDFYRFCSFRKFLEKENRTVDQTIVERLDENMKPVLDGNASRGL